MAEDSVTENQTEKAQVSARQESIKPGATTPAPQSDLHRTITATTVDESSAQRFLSLQEDNSLSESIQQLIGQLTQRIQLDTRTAIDQVEKKYQSEQRKLHEELKNAQLLSTDWQAKESDYLAQLDAFRAHQEASERESQKQLTQLNAQLLASQLKVREQGDELRHLKQSLVMKEDELLCSSEANTKLLEAISSIRPDYEQLKEQIIVAAQLMQIQDDPKVEPTVLLTQLMDGIQELKNELRTKNELLAKFGRGFYEQISKPEE